MASKTRPYTWCWWDSPRVNLISLTLINSALTNMATSGSSKDRWYLSMRLSLSGFVLWFNFPHVLVMDLEVYLCQKWTEEHRNPGKFILCSFPSSLISYHSVIADFGRAFRLTVTLSGGQADNSRKFWGQNFQQCSSVVLEA
jgi:hypothetical protein